MGEAFELEAYWANSLWHPTYKLANSIVRLVYTDDGLVIMQTWPGQAHTIMIMQVGDREGQLVDQLVDQRVYRTTLDKSYSARYLVTLAKRFAAQVMEEIDAERSDETV